MSGAAYPWRLVFPVMKFEVDSCRCRSYKCLCVSISGGTEGERLPSVIVNNLTDKSDRMYRMIKEQ